MYYINIEFLMDKRTINNYIHTIDGNTQSLPSIFYFYATHTRIRRKVGSYSFLLHNFLHTEELSKLIKTSIKYFCNFSFQYYYALMYVPYGEG